MSDFVFDAFVDFAFGKGTKHGFVVSGTEHIEELILEVTHFVERYVGKQSFCSAKTTSYSSKHNTVRCL